jgi:hypothetical protein
MRELQKSECDLASGGTQPIKYINGPAPGTTVTPLPGPVVIGYPQPPIQINFNTGTGSQDNSSNNIGEDYVNPPNFVGATWIGTHIVDDRCWTSNNGKNNPGDLKYGTWAAKHGGTGTQGGFATFATEQEGRYALGCLLDGSYAGSSIGNMFNTFNRDTPQNPDQAQQETANVESIMAALGYNNFNTNISAMDNSEFNSLLDAITQAEGTTNMDC